jgi:hypothetical protein
LAELVEELMLIWRKIRFWPLQIWGKELSKFSIAAERSGGFGFEIGELLLAAGQLLFEFFQRGAGVC